MILEEGGPGTLRIDGAYTRIIGVPLEFRGIR